MSARALAVVGLLWAGVVHVQAQDSEQSIAYYNRTATGTLVGGQHGLVTGSVTTIHGISVGSVAVGVGVGVEGYQRWRTVPIFGSVSYYPHGARESGLFFQVNAGHSICRLLNQDQGMDIEVEDARGGFMFSPMLGYQVVTGKLTVDISAGYKMQKMGARYSAGWLPLAYTIDEQADRFMFQIGVGF